MRGSHPTRIGIGSVVVGLFALAWIYPSRPAAGPPVQATAPASDIVTLEIRDTTVSPADSLHTLAVYLTNPESEVAGFQLNFVASRPDLVMLPESVAVETLIYCPLPPDCDTSIDTMTVVPIDLTGSVVTDWELLITNAPYPINFRMVAVAEVAGGVVTPPLPPSDEPQLLFHMIVARLPDSAVFDTLGDREVTWYVSPVGTGFSDSQGHNIGDTANIFLDGTVIFEQLCTVGDADGNRVINSTDIIYLVNHAFKSGPPPVCGGITGDVNCSGAINSTDVIYLVVYVFKSGPPPCAR